MNQAGDKPEIKYPTDWSYTIIGKEYSHLEQVAKEVLGARDYTIEPSKSSSGKKYYSAKVTCTVKDEFDRLDIYETLRSHSDIKIVL